jgi:hypothetical protein
MKARKVYEALRRQLHQRGLLRPRYLKLGESAVLARVRRELDEAMRDEHLAEPEPAQKITETELDYYFGGKK